MVAFPVITAGAENALVINVAKVAGGGFFIHDPASIFSSMG